MKKTVLTLVAVVLFALPVFAQQAAREGEIKRTVPYSAMLREDPTMTLDQYNGAVRALAQKELKQEAAVTPRFTPTPAPWTPLTTPRRTYTEPTYTPPVVTPSYPAYTAPTPRSGTTYDWPSGNTYRWRTDASGNTKVDGTNLNTGSMWNTTIKPNGSMNGTDSKSNPWTYDARTKTYINMGTGKICVGEGYARVCS